MVGFVFLLPVTANVIYFSRAFVQPCPINSWFFIYVCCIANTHANHSKRSKQMHMTTNNTLSLFLMQFVMHAVRQTIVHRMDVTISHCKHGVGKKPHVPSDPLRPCARRLGH